ncbi:hypothetical protein BY458DRAFT_515977 [Sporodiniella umbellata]|nr:hypothetical protein BY458DRAFT_515977 [Sporodiniella umbellata]
MHRKTSLDTLKLAIRSWLAYLHSDLGFNLLGKAWKIEYLHDVIKTNQKSVEGPFKQHAFIYQKS